MKTRWWAIHGRYGADLDSLPEPFQSELQQKWNAWLLLRYSTDSKLKDAWMAGITPVGPGLLVAGSNWSDEHQGDAQSTMILERAFTLKAAPPISVTVKKTDGT